MQIAETGANTSFFAASAALNATGGITAAQLSPAIAVTTNASDMDVSAVGCLTTTFRCVNRGSLTLTFSHAVTNPVIHISGIGGTSGSAFYHTSFLMSSSDAVTLPTFTKLGGNTAMTVTAGEIRSTAINGGTSCTAGTAAGCGSVRINGTFTTVTMQLDLLMGGSGSPTGADGWTITASVDEDFGDAPGSYDPTAAASHIVGGYFMGTAPTVENAALTNLLATPRTPSPIASATASSDANDNGVTFPTLTRSVASTIDVAVTGAGGRLQGWIDWADDGNFTTAGDQIATNAVDGGAGDTDGVVNGVIRLAVTPPAGTTQVTTISRFRWSPTAGVAFNTRGTVGEVEDYEVIVYPQRADLSLTKTVSNASPSSGSSISYVLTVTSAASPASTATATGITVQDSLPAGFTFTGATGAGSYNNFTGVWTVGSLAPGANAAITITGTVTAVSGTVTNVAQISASSLTDPDSTPNNGVTTEDDYASVAFTVASVLAAPTCPAGGTNQIIANGTFTAGTGPSWTSWTASAIWTGTNVAAVNNDTTSGALSQSGLTGLKFGPGAGGGSVIQLSQWWRNGGPALGSTSAQLDVTVAGTLYARVATDPSAGTSATVTYFNGATGNLTSITEFISTGWRINLPTTVAATGAIAFNFTPGGGTSDDFEVDNVTLYTCTPGQLSVTKISSTLSDGISASNPKSIPGALVRYCILVTNTGSVTTSNVSVSDPLPTDVTYVAGSMTSGTGCGTAATAEDDDDAGADETDPFGMSITGSTITGTASTLSVGASYALVFNAIVD
ncbi:MAG: GEVED domain-containing protein [Sphingorhabdus sp.]